MEEKDFIKYWIWLTQIPYVGSVMEGRLLAKFKSPQDIYDADEKCLRKISGITKRQIASILQARSFDRAEKILEDCEKKKIYVLTKADIRYPEKAKQIISLAEGMTHSEWSRINHLINTCFESQEAKVTFVQPKQLDLLMKQNVIL